MSQNTEKKSLPFFGIGKVLPFTKKYRGVMFLMVACGLMSTGIDLLMPQTQRYALNHLSARTRWIRCPSSSASTSSAFC